MWGAVTHRDPDLEHDSDAKQGLPCQWYHCTVDVLFHKNSQGSSSFKRAQQRKWKTTDKSALLLVWMRLHELQLLPCGSDARKSLSLFFSFPGLPPPWRATWIWPNTPWTSRPAPYNLRAVRTFFFNNAVKTAELCSLNLWQGADGWAWCQMKAIKAEDQNIFKSLSLIFRAGICTRSSECVCV